MATITQKPFWAMPVDEVLHGLATKREGLSSKDVEERRKEFGYNEIVERPRTTRFVIMLRQLANPLILVLVGAGILTVFLREWVNAGVIFAAVLINSILGFWQEYRAERALALLSTYVRARARVRRDGKELEVDASELVPGDIIRISQGDRVPADARLVFVNSVEVDEAVLTGESLPVPKDIAPLSAAMALPERRSMVFGGTFIIEGFGDAVVTAIGDRTELGKIALLLKREPRESTPLEKAVQQFTIVVGGILAILITALFFIGIARGYAVVDMFLIATAATVSAVPEGLPIALTVILAIGVSRLAKRKGVVRRLLAAESLGSTTIILTDKTGTLTQAKMDLTTVIPYAVRDPAEESVLLETVLYATDVVIENPNDPPSSWRMVGRAVETALVRAAALRAIHMPQIASADVIRRIPFSSQHKFSATVVRHGSEFLTVLLGAPEVVVSRTTLSLSERGALLEEVERRAFSGERILGVATNRINDANYIPSKSDDLRELTFGGLFIFRDPLRREVGDAIRRIGRAGVKTVIVTGDHRGTAEAVARELGMVDGKGAVLTGDDLVHLSREELMGRSGDTTVYARVTPEQKMMLVKLYREQGEVVAVTGDGVNDAPALQAADIGIALGSGTDVAKNAADLVILDDNFGTIVAAIEEGRRIVGNIRKVIVYLLSDVFDELFLIGGALLFGVALPLNALQILFVNFFSDSFPAVAFAFEKGVDDGLNGKPKKVRSLLDSETKFLIFVIGALTSALLFGVYYLLLRFGFPADLARTFIFASFATYSLILAFSLRSLERSVVSYNPFSNRHLTTGVGIGVVLTACAVYIPFFQKVFDTVSLPPLWLLAVFGVGIANIVSVEFGKWLFRR